METATKRGPDGVKIAEGESIDSVLAKLDYDGIRYKVEIDVDKFDRRCFAAVREMFDLPDTEWDGEEWAEVEPTGAQLLAWKRQADAEALAELHELTHVDGNLLTRIGRKRFIDRFIAVASNQGLDATHARIGVGDGSTAAADTDTDLSAAAGSTHRQFKLVDSVASGSGASSGVFTAIATFGTSLANFAWAEWGVDGGTADGTTVTSEGNTTPGLINRKVTSLGTKTSAASWVFTITITLT